MPSIGYLLGDSAFDATVKSLKNGKGFGFIGNIGGGLLKSAGSLALGTAELTGKGVMSGTGTVGKGLINSFKGNPYAVIGSALTGMAAGHIVADMDGQADTTKTMAHGALYATGASALGGAALVSGFGAAALGAGMTGVNALGAVGSHFVTAKTKGEKYNEVVKNFKREEAWTDTQYKEKLASEVEKVGAKVGSKEAMDIGLGNLNDFKLRKGFAIPMIVGASAIKGIAGGVRAFEKSRMGMNDGRMRSATPDIPMPQVTNSASYANNAGATGDLVFALHNNRR